MNRLLKVSLLVGVLLVAVQAAQAQVDMLGKVDTLWAEIARIDDFNWTVTVSYFNDEAVVGLSVPFRMTAGLNRIVADSAIYTGGRAEKFAVRAFRADTAIQCVTLGMIANLGPTHIRIEKGTGRLATVFISSLEKKPIEKLTIDTTTTHPNNSLLVIADSIQGPPPDTARLDDKQVQIIPAFVVRKAK